MTDTTGCLGKSTYATRAEASDARSRIRKRPDFKADAGIDVYHCAKCGSFHLGRDARKGPKAIRKPRHELYGAMARLARYKEPTRRA